MFSRRYDSTVSFLALADTHSSTQKRKEERTGSHGKNMRFPTRPRRRCVSLLLAAAAVVAVSAVPLADPANDAGALKALGDAPTLAQLQLPLACLPRNYMVDEISLSLDHISELAASPACVEAASAGERLLSRLHERLYATQQGSTCPTQSLSWTDPFNTGAGGTLHSLVKPMLHNFARNLTMLTPAMPGWTGPECGNTMACFFQPLAPACEGTDPLRVEERKHSIMNPYSHAALGGDRTRIKVWGAAFTGEDPRADLHFAADLAEVEQRMPDVHNYINQNMVREARNPSANAPAPCLDPPAR